MTTIKRFLRLPQHSSKLPAYKTLAATNRAFINANADWTTKRGEKYNAYRDKRYKLGKIKKAGGRFYVFQLPE